MATRRRPPLTQENDDRRRSSLGNKQSTSGGAGTKTPLRTPQKQQQQTQPPVQDVEMTEQPMAGDALDDANMSDDEEGGTRIGDIYIPPPIPPYCSTESKGPRLIIKKIENFNFKSYAGKVVLGPFHHVSTDAAKQIMNIF